VTAIDWAEIQKDVDAQLERAGVVEHADVGLDRAQVESHAREIAAGRLSKATNVVPGEVRAAGSEHVDSLESLSERERADLEARGREAIARGRVAVAVLNGGMATRFGGDVKNIIRRSPTRRSSSEGRAGARLRPVPFLIMNSFATHARTLEFCPLNGPTTTWRCSCRASACG
jgi:UTP--glucose-1-phosphate uridylyltransferase